MGNGTDVLTKKTGATLSLDDVDAKMLASQSGLLLTEAPKFELPKLSALVDEAVDIGWLKPPRTSKAICMDNKIPLLTHGRTVYCRLGNSTVLQSAQTQLES